MKGVKTSKIFKTKFPPSLSTRSAAAACHQYDGHKRRMRSTGYWSGLTFTAPRLGGPTVASGVATWQSTSRRMFHSCLRYSPLSSASPSAATRTTPLPCVSDSTTPAKCLRARAGRQRALV
jgi:hypothetical protein